MKFSTKTLIFLTAAALFVAPLVMAEMNQFPERGDVAVCTGNKDKEIETPWGVFNAPSTGVIASRISNGFVTSAGLSAVRLKVIDFTDNGSAEGLGAYSFRLDSSRQAGTSWLQQNKDGSFTQVMNFHLTATIEAFGTQTLHTAAPANVAADLQTFPQTGATYDLLAPVDLVDGNGKTVATIHGATVVMTSTKVY